jgi:Uma2 family endonuclease
MLVLEIIAILREQLVSTGWGIVLTAPVGLFMPGCDPVQPDILAIRAADRATIGARRITGVPALLVEVLSPSNADYDLMVKRAAYARAGVPEYWVARPAERDFLVHSEPESAAGQYLRVEHVPATDVLVSPTLPLRFAVADCFAGVV